MEEDKKIAEITHKIDADFILSLYKKAKKAKGKKRKELLKNAATLSNHIGKYLAIKK